MEIYKSSDNLFVRTDKLIKNYDEIIQYIEANPYFTKQEIIDTINDLKPYEQLSHGLIQNKILSTIVTVNSTTPVDLTALFFTGLNAVTINENSTFYYDSVNNLIRAVDTTINYYSIDFLLLLSGSISGASSSEFFVVNLERPNGNIFRSIIVPSEINQTFQNKQFCSFNSYVGSGGNDNWQLPLTANPGISGGFRISIARQSGNAKLTLNTTNIQSIRIQR